MITDTEIIAAIIRSNEGDAIADQFQSINDGDPMEDQNPNALRRIARILRDFEPRNDDLANEASGWADEIEHHLNRIKDNADL